MSTHLRSCPQHHRSMPCNIPTCRYAASAIAPVEAAPVEAAPIEVAPPAPAQLQTATPPVANRRGRPPKGDQAMTPAERKRRSRLNADEKEKDIERRNLIARILR